MGIKLTNLQKKYGDRVVLDNVNLQFPEKGLFYIIGDSGVGKTTLLNLLSSFDSEYDGEIMLSFGNEEIDLKEVDQSTIWSEIYDFVFQDYNLVNSLSVKNNIIISEILSGRTVNEDDCIEVCNDLGIADCINRDVQDLSGGEKQRVAIARAIIRNNPIILADEPTGNLDKENSAKIFDILKALSKKNL